MVCLTSILSAGGHDGTPLRHARPLLIPHPRSRGTLVPISWYMGFRSRAVIPRTAVRSAFSMRAGSAFSMCGPGHPRPSMSLLSSATILSSINKATCSSSQVMPLAPSSGDGILHVQLWSLGKMAVFKGDVWKERCSVAGFPVSGGPFCCGYHGSSLGIVSVLLCGTPAVTRAAFLCAALSRCCCMRCNLSLRWALRSWTASRKNAWTAWATRFAASHLTLAC